jgi:hypothetical protein
MPNLGELGQYDEPAHLPPKKKKKKKTKTDIPHSYHIVLPIKRKQCENRRHNGSRTTHDGCNELCEQMEANNTQSQQGYENK